LELREGRARLAIEGQELTLSQLGLHQAKNALLAWAVGRELALEPSEIAEALQSVHLPAGRGQLVQQGTVTILDDCYNANPASFRAAIATARALRGDRPLIFVAGTMLELGPETDRFHREIAAELVALGPDLLAGVGRFQDALEAHRADLGARLVVASDAPAMAALLKDRVPDGSLVVLKGSRGMALERLLPVLRAGGTS
jgi:UDP-N-acetylmuramoyl-tripeptide--D-alanyl-D-alanine ligase